MEVNTEGYLNPQYNKDLFSQVDGGILNDIKTIYIKLLDEDMTKVTNILKIYNKNTNLSIPIFNSKEGGKVIKLSTQKLSKYIGKSMLNTTRKDWFNKKYNVKFTIKKYKFYQNDKEINGIKFILKELELKN